MPLVAVLTAVVSSGALRRTSCGADYTRSICHDSYSGSTTSLR